MDALLYENGKIRITKNLFANGQGETFMIPGLRSVREEHKGKSVVPLMIGLLLMATGGFFALPFAYGREGLGAAGLLLVAWYFTQKDKYVIYVTGAQGETAAFRTRDAQVHRDVLGCLRKAMSLHKAG